MSSLLTSAPFPADPGSPITGALTVLLLLAATTTISHTIVYLRHNSPIRRR